MMRLASRILHPQRPIPSFWTVLRSGMDHTMLDDLQVKRMAKMSQTAIVLLLGAAMLVCILRTGYSCWHGSETCCRTMLNNALVCTAVL